MLYDTADQALIATGFGTPSFDGITPDVGNRILVKDQTDPKQNGIYVVTTLGEDDSYTVLTRAADFNESTEVYAGTRFFVRLGSLGGNKIWAVTTDLDEITVDTDPINFAIANTNPSGAEVHNEIIIGDGTTNSWTFASAGVSVKSVQVFEFESGILHLVQAAVSINEASGAVTVEFDEAPETGDEYKVVIVSYRTCVK
ncbi:hypothetical protein FACS1894120_6000 [Clostridia bacterium]|nr:hypothetical protein FACS1894120_6000 [Clostridia bacterium]